MRAHKHTSKYINTAYKKGKKTLKTTQKKNISIQNKYVSK